MTNAQLNVGQKFDRVLIVMFENQYRSYVSQDPFMKKLASAGANMSNYFGAFHPSQTNYLASLAGEVCGITNDNPPDKPLPQDTLVDLLEKKGTSWKAYMEGYPGDPWQSSWTGTPPTGHPLDQFPPKDNSKGLSRYYRKHNAFASFASIQASEDRWNKIVGEAEFWRDVNDSQKNALPNYSWFTPDIWNDGHYLYNTHVDTNPRTQLVPQVAGWLEYVFFGKIPADKVQGAADFFDLQSFDLELVEGSGELSDNGKSLVIIAPGETSLHIRIFDGAGRKVVDKKVDAPTGEEKQLIDKFRQERGTQKEEKEEKEKIVDYAASITGYTDLGFDLNIDDLLSDCSSVRESAWTNSRVPKGTLIVVTFDEADYDAVGYDTSYDGPNQVYTVLLGDMIEPGTVIETPYNHYSLIKTIEKNFDLGTLDKNDRDANWFRFLWGEKFSWDLPRAVESEAGKVITKAKEAIAVSFLNGDAHLVIDDGTGELQSFLKQDCKWSGPVSTNLKGHAPLAMATLDDTLHLVFAAEEGKLSHATFSNGNWSEALPLDQAVAGSIAMTAYRDDADDDKQKLMLCWQSENQYIKYLIFADGKWQDEPGEIGQLTDGPMTLAQMGPSLYLVYKERNTRKMRITSFNTAPFNKFDAVTFKGKAAPDNNTSLHKWSPADFHVGHFANKMAALQNDYQADGGLAMATIEGEMHLVHRAAYEDTKNAFTEVFGLTGIFTAAKQVTNGYGTLAQAGWTLEREMPDMELDPKSGIAIASTGEELLLVWQHTGTNQLMFRKGKYRHPAAACPEDG